LLNQITVPWRWRLSGSLKHRRFLYIWHGYQPVKILYNSVAMKAWRHILSTFTGRIWTGRLDDWRNSGKIAQPDHCSLKTKTEWFSEMSEVFIQLTWLSACEDITQWLTMYTTCFKVN
jgi:hypothetical protein